MSHISADTTELEHLASRVSQVLAQHSLPSWLALVDRENCGYQLEPGAADRDKHYLLATSRLLWTFSHSCLHVDQNHQELLEAAKSGYSCLTEHLLDTRHGGFYWETSSTGTPLDKNKYLYGQAFAIYGLVEYWRTSKVQAALDLAIETFHHVETNSRDHKYGGWMEHCDEAWSPLPADAAVPMDHPGLKSANALLHWMEALTELYLEHPTAEFRAALTEALSLNNRYFFSRKIIANPSYRTQAWKPARQQSFRHVFWGHWIEFSWLRIRAENALGKALSTRHLALLAELAWRFAHTQNLGFVPASRIPKLPRKATTRWWVQAEFLIAMTTLAQHGGSARWQRRLIDFTQWILNVQIDAQSGLWRDHGQPSSSPWKAGYHEIRAMIIFSEAFKADSAKSTAILR
ncbi:MAG: AGE family epimerase/isomerase [bacterium]